jgi:hypothetical protein
MSKKVERAATYVRVSIDAQTVENQIRELRPIADGLLAFGNRIEIAHGSRPPRWRRRPKTAAFADMFRSLTTADLFGSDFANVVQSGGGERTVRQIVR